MTGKDYYQSLGIGRNSSADEIKSAFRRLARQYHPDINKESGAETKFKEINEAYQVLGDPQKKAQYDRFGSAGPGPQGFDMGNINIEDLFEGFSGGGGFGDIFESFFGSGGTGRRKKNGPERGNDLRYDLEISLEEAYSGMEKEIETVSLKTCTKCKGIGAESSSSIKKCTACDGAGQVRQSTRTIFGSFAQVVPCAACGGRGETIKDPCKECRGAGRTKEKNRLNVSIPKGIDTGYRLRISGAGDSGVKGGNPGDLFIFIDVKQHDKLKRQGDNLFTSEAIDFVTAILGDEIEIRLFGEKAKLKIPAGTQPNTVLRMKGKGMPRLHGSGSGDLFVEIQVQIPTRVSREQIELLKKIKGIK